MYGLAGFMLGAKAGGASVNLGYGYEMEAIAACTIGGVSVTCLLYTSQIQYVQHYS